MKNFLAYVNAKILEKSEEMAFKIYVTDSLKGIFKGMGGEVSMRYYDIVSEKKVETRTPEEVIGVIREKIHKLTEVTT